MSARSIVRRAALAALVVAAAFLASLPAPHSPAGAFVFSKAPPFRIKDLEGKTLDSKALLARGPVLLDFWATWCKPCHAAIPELEAWRKAYGDRGLTIVGVSVDGPRNHAKVRPFVARMGIHYPVAIDQDGRLQQRYQVVALPTAVLIDTSGTVVASRVGFRPGESASFGAKIAALLPAAGDSTSTPTPP